MKLAARFRDRTVWFSLARGAAAMLLLVWLAWLLADTVWLAWKGPVEPVPVAPSLETVTVSGQQGETLVSHQQVRDWALFGRYEAVAQEADASGPVDAPETRLRLELLGVFQTGDSEQAGAIIAQQGGEGELFRPGQALPGNATLEEVYADRVILRRQGRLETLKLKEPSLQGGVERSEPAPSREPASVSRSSQPSRGPELGPRGSVERRRKQIISGLALENTDAGYRITEGAPAEVLSQVGLQPGDVIVSVNGHQVGNKEADLAALREYDQTQSATIVVQRGAQRFTVTVPP